MGGTSALDGLKKHGVAAGVYVAQPACCGVSKFPLYCAGIAGCQGFLNYSVTISFTIGHNTKIFFFIYLLSIFFLSLLL